MTDMKAVLNYVAEGRFFSREETRVLFDFLVSGEATRAQIAALLMGLRMRKESIEEITGAAQAMRARMVTVHAPAGAIDIVGTGGDGTGTYNISTTAAFIVAGAGVPVAKHGNRAVSSKSGAADVLKALGVEILQTAAGVEHCLAEAGIGFMFAPAHHPALRPVMPVRQELAIRTIFNVLGPLLNPAGVKRHLVGVYTADLVEPIACALRELGSENAIVVHGADGLDEMTTTGPTQMAVLSGGEVRRQEITPEEAGLARVPVTALKGGDGQANAKALRGVLAGKPGAYRDVALLNAAGGLIAAGAAPSWPDALALARASVDGGHALQTLERLVAASAAAAAQTAGSGAPR